MAQLDNEAANWQLSQDLHHDGHSFSVCNHGTVRSGDVEVALVELAPSAALGLRLVATVHAQGVSQGVSQGVNTSK